MAKRRWSKRVTERVMRWTLTAGCCTSGLPGRDGGKRRNDFHLARRWGLGVQPFGPPACCLRMD
jgi:hypothetical protein